MIAKCITVFAVVAQIIAQISASGCGIGQSTIILPPCESNSSPVTPISSGSSGSSFSDSFASASLARNIVAKGRYSVALRHCGPIPGQRIPVTTSRIVTPVQERPPVRLPANIPPPRTICHSCTCYKTVLRPTVHDHYITVPTIQRYVETGHKPVIESIQYEAIPLNCDRSAAYSLGSGLRLLEVGQGSVSGGIKFGDSGCSCGCQKVHRPQVEVVEVPCGQCVEAPEIETAQIPQSVCFECMPQC